MNFGVAQISPTAKELARFERRTKTFLIDRIDRIDRTDNSIFDLAGPSIGSILSMESPEGIVQNAFLTADLHVGAVQFLRGLDFVQASHGQFFRCGVQGVRRLVRNAGNLEQGVAEHVKRFP